MNSEILNKQDTVYNFTQAVITIIKSQQPLFLVFPTEQQKPYPWSNKPYYNAFFEHIAELILKNFKFS